VIGYLRVSTAAQEYGIEAQRNAITAEAVRRGWQVEFIEDAGKSGQDIERSGIRHSLDLSSEARPALSSRRRSTGSADPSLTSPASLSCPASRGGASWLST
jgi:hypothetical protein